jgi:ATP-dependent protease Clp ATPase subunit
MSKKIKVGVVGIGGIGRGTHLEAWMTNPDVEVVAVCDIIRERAEKAAQKHNIPYVFEDYKDLIALEDLDLVDICTPNKYHSIIAGTTLKSKGIGFTADQTESLENSVKEALKEIFRPEFLNRVDDVVIFTELSKDDIKRIAVLMLNDLSKDLAEKHVRLEYADDVIEFLAEKGYNRQYGARPLRRAVQTYVEDLLSDLYLRGKLKAYDTARLFVNDGNLDIHITQGREE